MTANLATYLYQWRQNKNVTRGELSEKSGITVANISMIESNEFDPDETTCAKLAEGMTKITSQNVTFKDGYGFYDEVHWLMVRLCAENDICPRFLWRAMQKAQANNEFEAEAAINQLFPAKCRVFANVGASLRYSILTNAKRAKQAIERIYELEQTREAA